jgi:hypothetical protein
MAVHADGLCRAPGKALADAVELVAAHGPAITALHAPRQSDRMLNTWNPSVLSQSCQCAQQSTGIPCRPTSFGVQRAIKDRAG